MTLKFCNTGSSQFVLYGGYLCEPNMKIIAFENLIFLLVIAAKNLLNCNKHTLCDQHFEFQFRVNLVLRVNHHPLRKQKQTHD